jgi:Ribbon-helix-helix protein, copG family
MKLSVSLPASDVAFLDRYARARGITSRSAALQSAVDSLRVGELAPAYAEAFSEWSAEDEAAWESTSADGLAGS